jgi:hypothetical protein
MTSPQSNLTTFPPLLHPQLICCLDPSKLLRRLPSSIRRSLLQQRNLAILSNRKHTPLSRGLLCSSLLDAKGFVESVFLVTEEGVVELLARHKGLVLLWRITGKTVNGVAGGCEGSVGVAEVTGLLGA